MKRILSRITAAGLTLALTAGMLKIASLALNYRYNYNENGDVPSQFYKNKMEYDVLFLGSSHVGCGIYPMQLWDERGISSYNLAVSAALIPSSFHIFKNAICRHKPKIAMLDTLRLASNEKVSYQLDSLHYAFDIIPLSRQKYESLKDLFPDSGRQMTYILPYSLFHNRWREMTVEKAWDALFHTKVSVTKGAWFPCGISMPSIYPQTDCLLPNNTLGMDYIRAFISLCRENSVIPVLLTVPYPAGETGQKEENSAALLSKELGVPYYNLNKTDVIDWDTDLLDSDSHVNMSGGRKVTDWIGRLLVESYGLADYRGDPAYASWYDDYQQYKHKLFDLIRSQTDIKSALMLCNNAVYTACLSVKDGTELDSVIQKLVAQIGDAITVENVRDSGNAEASGDDNQDSTPPACDIHLEVYDSETGDFVCAKNWDFQSRTEFVYRN